MEETIGNGLPRDLSKIEYGQHTVLNDPIIMKELQFGSNVRRSLFIKRGNDCAGVTAAIVLLGDCPGQNQEVPVYYKITREQLIGDLSLLSIEENSVVVTDGGKVIDIFKP